MGKKGVRHRPRFIAVMVIALLLTADIIMVVLFAVIGIKGKSTKTIDSYKLSSEIKYDLNFIDNAFYSKTNLELGTAYIVRYIDTVSLSFLYSFDSGIAENINGNYSVDAVIEAKYNSENVLWKKKLNLVPEESFTMSNIAKNIELHINEYRALAKGITDDAGISASTNMTIIYTVNASAVIDGIPVEETSVSTLVFALDQDVLIMGGEPKYELKKDVTAAIQYDMLPKDMTFYIGIPLFAVLTAALLYILLFTVGIRPDPVEVGLKTIYKKYAGRIIELRAEQGQADYAAISTKTFRDLLLIADELKKPIFKNTATEPTEIEFYVIDGVIKYLFRAEDLRAKINQPEESPVHT